MKKTVLNNSSDAVATAPINKNVIKVRAGKSTGLSLRIICIVAIAILTLTCLSVPGQTAAGGYHSLALKSDGSVVVWGYNGSGQWDVPSSLNLKVIFKTPGIAIAPIIYLLLSGI